MGVDPGQKGAVVVITDGKISYKSVFKLLSDGSIDREHTSRMIRYLYRTYDVSFVFVEDVHSVFGASAKANFNFGRNVEVICTILSVFKIPHIYVKPKDWQKVAWDGIAKVKKAGKKNAINTKATSLLAVKKLFPRDSFLATKRSKVPHDGLVDASLIAWYGYLKI